MQIEYIIDMISFIIFGNKYFVMNEIIEYFKTIPSSHRALILASGIAFFWLVGFGQRVIAHL